MHSNGIVFVAPHVQAIRSGAKRQTRRLLSTDHKGRPVRSEWARLPPGARLWVKEPGLRLLDRTTGHMTGFRYAADEEPDIHRPVRWNPGRHMPILAARLFLTVTETRIEQLQDIGDADCAAEGITTGELGFGTPGMPHTWAETPRDAFARLWDGIHHTATWATNPPVVVIDFQPEQQEQT
jgi:hypothetical protein